MIEEYRLAVSLSLFLVVLCLFYSLCFYQLSSYFNSVLHSFYIKIFIHNFLLFVNTFIPKTGFYKYSTGGPVFSTILSYSILVSFIIAIFLEHCLC